MLGTGNWANGGHDPSCASLSVPLPYISKLQARSTEYSGLVLHACDEEENTSRHSGKRLSHVWSSCFGGPLNEPKLNSNRSSKDRSFCVAVLLGRAIDALGTLQPDVLLKAWLAVDQAATYALIAAERCAADGKAFQLRLQTNATGNLEECQSAGRGLLLPQRLLQADVDSPYGVLLIQSCLLEIGPNSDGHPRPPRPAVLVRPAPRPSSLSSHPAPPLSLPGIPPIDPAASRLTILRKPDPFAQPQSISAASVVLGASSIAASAAGRGTSVGGAYATESASCLPVASLNTYQVQQVPAAAKLSLAAPAEQSARLHGWGAGEVWMAALESGPQLVTVLHYPGSVLYQNSNSRDFYGDLSTLTMAAPRLLSLLLAAEKAPGGIQQRDATTTTPTEDQVAAMVARLVEGEVISTLVHLPSSMMGAVALTAPWPPPHTTHTLPSAIQPCAAPITTTGCTAVQPHDGSTVAVSPISSRGAFGLGLQRKPAQTEANPFSAPSGYLRGPVCDPLDRQLLAALDCNEPSVRVCVRNQLSCVPAEMTGFSRQKPNNVPLSRDMLTMPLRMLKPSGAFCGDGGGGGRPEGWASAGGLTGVTDSSNKCSVEANRGTRALVAFNSDTGAGAAAGGAGSGGAAVANALIINATLANVNMSNEMSAEREQSALIPDTSLGIIVGGANGDEDSAEVEADVTFACLAQPLERQSSVHLGHIFGAGRATAAASAAVNPRKGTKAEGTVSCLLPYFSYPVEPAPAIPSYPPLPSTAEVSEPLPLSGQSCTSSSPMPAPQPRRRPSALPHTLQRLMDAAAAAGSSHKRHQPFRRLTSDLSAASEPNPSLLKLTAGLQSMHTLPPRKRALLADTIPRPSSQPVLPPPPPLSSLTVRLATTGTRTTTDTMGEAEPMVGTAARTGGECRLRPTVSVTLEEVPLPADSAEAPSPPPPATELDALRCAAALELPASKDEPLPLPPSILDGDASNVCATRIGFLDSHCPNTVHNIDLSPCLSDSVGTALPCLLAGEGPASSLLGVPSGSSPPPFSPTLPPPRSFDLSCLYEPDGNAEWYEGGVQRYNGSGETGRGVVSRPATATDRQPMRFARHSTSSGPISKLSVMGPAGVLEQHRHLDAKTATVPAALPLARNRIQTSGSGRARRQLLHTDTHGRVQMLLSNFIERSEQQQQQRQQQQHELQRQRHQQQQQQQLLQQQQYRRPSSGYCPASCDVGLSGVRKSAEHSEKSDPIRRAAMASPKRHQRAVTATAILECKSPSLRFALEGQREGAAWRAETSEQVAAGEAALDVPRFEGACGEEESGGGGGSGGGGSSGLTPRKATAGADTASASQQMPAGLPSDLPPPPQQALSHGGTPSLWHQVHIRLQPEASAHISDARALGDCDSENASTGGGDEGGGSDGGGGGGMPLDPRQATARPLVLVVTQVEVTPLVEAQLSTASLLQQEHRVLESIFPRHCIEYLTLRGHITAGSCTATGRGAGGSPIATAAEGNDSNGASVPAKLASLATWHPGVTILFCDIVGFTTACHSAPAFAVMAFLNELYSRFDALVDIYKVYKVETIGDCYMVAGGLVAYDEDGYKSVISGGEDPLHAVRVMEFAKAMLRTASGVRMPHTGQPVQLRVGLHSGPVTSGVVGDRMPRFCLFGDTVNTASRMESTCRPGAIHVSAATQALLPREPWSNLGCSEVKGKGQMRTYEWAGQADEPLEEGQVQRVLGLYL